MIQVYTDDHLLYDSRLENLRLLRLSVTTSVDKAGTATLVLPPDHPHYSNIVAFKTLVTIYKDGVLLFRGRALPPSDDFYKRRTIICEGERCLLQDGTHRPYLYQDSPVNVFATVIGLYNAQVEAAKQFAVGTVTVTDANDYIRVESSTAEQFGATIDKLVDRCGGYITFTTNDNGQREINWLAELTYRSSQVIEFGQNMLDFSRSGANTDLATVIIPFGAMLEEGGRVTIESVNDGLDFIQDPDAVALRGWISKAVYWDDVTDPANLLRKAQQYLAQSKNMITTLQLSAVDLHAMDKDIDAFQVGDQIRVVSRPHDVDDLFLLTTRTENLLDPADDSITLGKDLAALTGLDVAGDRSAKNELHRVEVNLKADYQLGIAAAVAEAKTTLTSLIQQTEKAIWTEVGETYATNDQVQLAVSTSMEQLKDSFTFTFNTLEAKVDANDADAREQFATLEKYIRFVDGDIVLGESGNELVLRIQNDRISFLDGGAEVAYWNNKQMVVTDGHFLHSLRIGPFAFVPRENGNLSLVKVGE